MNLPSFIIRGNRGSSALGLDGQNMAAFRTLLLLLSLGFGGAFKTPLDTLVTKIATVVAQADIVGVEAPFRAPPTVPRKLVQEVRASACKTCERPP